MDGQERDDLKAQAETLRESISQEARARDRMHPQHRSTSALLLFVVVMGIPQLLIPSLRHRLSDRIERIREAAGPFPMNPPPAWAKVGENRYPFPSEFERPVVTRLPYPGTLDLSGTVYRASQDTGQGLQGGASAVEPGEIRESVDPVSGEAAPEFRQGKVEQEAYDLLLGSNATMAALVGGKNPSLRFQTWAAAKMEEDSFLVDVSFIQVDGGSEIHYTWRVKLLSRQVTPLSYHARSLPK